MSYYIKNANSKVEIIFLHYRLLCFIYKLIIDLYVNILSFGLYKSIYLHLYKLRYFYLQLLYFLLSLNVNNYKNLIS